MTNEEIASALVWIQVVLGITALTGFVNGWALHRLTNLVKRLVEGDVRRMEEVRNFYGRK